MAAESAEQKLRQLLTQSKESAAGDYAAGEAIALTGSNLEQTVRVKLVAGAHGANIEESLEATVRKGGGTGESVEQELLKTGLVGWT